eukprot:767834-Hanusia_phi.AAC.3
MDEGTVCWVEHLKLEDRGNREARKEGRRRRQGGIRRAEEAGRYQAGGGGREVSGMPYRRVIATESFSERLAGEQTTSKALGCQQVVQPSPS